MGFTAKQFILAMLVKEPGEQVKRYQALMRADEDEDFPHLMRQKKRSPILGENQFIKKLKKRFFEKQRHLEVPDSKQLSPDSAHIKKVICSYYNINEDQLYYTKRGAFNEARAMGVFLTRRLRGEGFKIIGEHFKIENYSTVSSVIERFKLRRQSDRKLSKKVDQVRHIIKSQGET